jgi:gliding motility-associated-like protein
VYNFVVKKLTIPNIVSPNGDGENDTWEIGGEGVKTVDLRVFSRWGKLVYEQSNYNNDWNAQDLPTGTYFYQLKIDNVANCTGWIQVMR